MKKLLFILVITIFTLTSCSKSKDASIIGKWQIVSAQENEKDIMLSSCEMYGNFEFFKNKDCIIKKAYEGQYEDCDPDILKGTYTFKDNVLTYKEGSDYETRALITELTPTNLKYTHYYIRDGRYLNEIAENEQRTYTLKRIK
ncbi:MAG TPA: lipocalin family protein [Flavobacterium sp.]